MKLQELVNKYKRNVMTSEEERILEEFIAAGKLTLNDFEELEIIDTRLSESIQVIPPKSLDTKFYTMLGEMKAKSERKFWLKNWFSSLHHYIHYALPVILFIGGILIGTIIKSTTTDEAAEDTSNALLVTSMIQNPSASERIKAVKRTSEAHTPDAGLINILLFSLNNDKSEIVRIAAIEALLRYAELENVRKGLIDAIRHQDSPLVIMNLAEALKLIGNEIPIDQYRDMLNKDLPKEAVLKIEEGLRII